jgi:hypothetical protein
VGAIVLIALVPARYAVAQGPTEAEIEEAVVRGLARLPGFQEADGGYMPDTSCERVAYTGLAITKLADRAIDLGMRPLDPAFEYSGVVAAGLAFIMSHKQVVAIAPEEPGRDPDGNGNGIGVYFNQARCGNHHQIYNTGIAMMALAVSGDQATYGVDLQDAVDFMAWAQNDPGCGVHRGGWGYGANDCSWSDNSSGGYATLGLGYAAAPPPFGFGLTIPQWVKDELGLWIDVIQDDVDGDPDDGGSWYNPDWTWNPWVNTLKTGNLIYEMGLVGDTVDDQRVQDAIDYIERHWANPIQCDTGWLLHAQAMFTMMKGLQSMGIDYLDLDGDGVAEHDWFAEVAQHLVDRQAPGGLWWDDCWGGMLLATIWDLLTLEKAVPTFEVPVPFDINPGSCPNPFNVGHRGVVAVAILGTEDLDVTRIDPASVTLDGVAPLRWSLEDVGTPFDPFLGKEDAFDCHELGSDGYPDLAIKFEGPELAAALGGVGDGDVLVLSLEGNLKEEFGSTPIVGEDVVLIIMK